MVDFEYIFADLMNLAVDTRAYLCAPLNFFRANLEKMYKANKVELYSLDQLELELEKLGYLKEVDWKKAKKRYIRSLKYKKSDKEKISKQVSFNENLNTVLEYEAEYDYKNGGYCMLDMGKFN